MPIFSFPLKRIIIKTERTGDDTSTLISYLGQLFNRLKFAAGAAGRGARALLGVYSDKFYFVLNEHSSLITYSVFIYLHWRLLSGAEAK